MPNLSLLVDVLAHIELDPESWNQDVWAQVAPHYVDGDKLPDEMRRQLNVGRVAVDHDAVVRVTGNACGTVACLAGWATLLSGAKPRWYARWSNQPDLGVFFIASESAVVYQGEPYLVDELAVKLLGLETDGPGHLFASSNTMKELYEEAADLFGVGEDDLRELVAARIGTITAPRALAPVPAGD